MNASFIWKVIYAAIIAALLFPLFKLGQPASVTANGQQRGGQLARLRLEHGLSQVNLGEIDPASESVKLACLGMRGVAANLLWLKTQEYKKTENWDALTATLNQITKLQPNFIKVWEFQAHNLSYNVSVEFDNYEHRYHWVKKGIDFLIEGTAYNHDHPRLLHFLGWFTGWKLGRADEHVQFRELFRKDKDFHESLANEIPDVLGPEAVGPERLFPDNWLVGRLWYVRAEEAYDYHDKRNKLRGKSPLVFYADKPKSRMNYAMAIEDEGHFEQAAMGAWKQAGAEWKEYGNRMIPSSWGVELQLGELQQVRRDLKEAYRQLDELVPGGRERVFDRKRAALSEQQRHLLDNNGTEDREEWTDQDWTQYMLALRGTEVTSLEVAREAPENIAAKAIRLAKRVEELKVREHRVDHYRTTVNYEYWGTRCEVEQTELATMARQLIYSANEKLAAGDLEASRADYEAAWDRWEEMFERWPALKHDDTGDDLRPALAKYRRVLNLLNMPDIPADFKLNFLLNQQQLAALQAQDAAPGESTAPGDSATGGPAPQTTRQPPLERLPADREGSPDAKPAGDKQPPLEDPQAQWGDPSRLPAAALLAASRPSLAYWLLAQVQAPPAPPAAAAQPQPPVDPARSPSDLLPDQAPKQPDQAPPAGEPQAGGSSPHQQASVACGGARRCVSYQPQPRRRWRLFRRRCR